MADTGRGTIDENALNIFTDGSSYPHRKRESGVGICFVTVNSDGDEVLIEYAPPGWKSATIDEMELMACIVALEEVSYFYPNISSFSKILLYSDSQYVVSNLNNARFRWKQAGWKSFSGAPIKNVSLWKRLVKLIEKSSIQVKIKWVKGHSKNKYNKAADRLAKESSYLAVQDPLTETYTTRKWSPNKTAKGSVLLARQTIIIRIISREEFHKSTNSYEYRYEVIQPDSPFYKFVDRIYFGEYISRNKCIKVEVNDDMDHPKIVSVLEMLDCSKFKY